MTTGQKIKAQLDELDTQKDNIVNILKNNGIEVSEDDKLEELVPKINSLSAPIEHPEYTTIKNSQIFSYNTQTISKTINAVKGNVVFAFIALSGVTIQNIDAKWKFIKSADSTNGTSTRTLYTYYTIAEENTVSIDLTLSASSFVFLQLYAMDNCKGLSDNVETGVISVNTENNDYVLSGLTVEPGDILVLTNCYGVPYTTMEKSMGIVSSMLYDEYFDSGGNNIIEKLFTYRFAGPMTNPGIMVLPQYNSSQHITSDGEICYIKIKPYCGASKADDIIDVASYKPKSIIFNLGSVPTASSSYTTTYKDAYIDFCNQLNHINFEDISRLRMNGTFLGMIDFFQIIKDKLTEITSLMELFYDMRVYEGYGSVNSHGATSIYPTIDMRNLNTANLTTMYGMFYNISAVYSTSSYTGASQRLNIYLNNMNTSKVTNMGNVFAQNAYNSSSNGYKPNYYYIYGLDTLDYSNVNAMSSMFQNIPFNLYFVHNNGTVFTNIVINGNTSNYDFPKLASTSSMFRNDNSTSYVLKSLTSFQLENLDFPEFTNASYMFYYTNVNASALKTFKLISCQFEKPVSLNYMFYNNTALTTFLLDNTVINISNASSMFYRCTALTSLNLSNLHSSSNINISNMFNGCTKLNYLDVRNITFSAITTASYYTGLLTSVPTTCEIIVKDNTEKEWFTSKFSTYTNVKTVAEYEAE